MRIWSSNIHGPMGNQQSDMKSEASPLDRQIGAGGGREQFENVLTCEGVLTTSFTN